jgi:hypothetical protein
MTEPETVCLPPERAAQLDFRLFEMEQWTGNCRAFYRGARKLEKRKNSIKRSDMICQ